MELQGRLCKISGRRGKALKERLLCEHKQRGGISRAHLGDSKNKNIINMETLETK